MSHGSCLLDGALATLQIAKKARCRGKAKQMIVLFNEAPLCAGSDSTAALEGITAANRERMKIHTIYIPEYAPRSQDTSFGQALAAANNGRYEMHDPAQ